MTTGYEARFYADVSRIAEGVDKLTDVLDAVRLELKQHRVMFNRHHEENQHANPHR